MMQKIFSQNLATSSHEEFYPLEFDENVKKIDFLNHLSAKLDTAQHRISIGKNVAEDGLPISCCCWNDNFGVQTATLA